MIQGNSIPVDTTWQTLDGRVLDVREMTDAHLKNAIKMLWRQGRTIHNTPVLYAMVGELANRKVLL